MRKIKPATLNDSRAIAEALGSLREARTLLRRAGAERACKAATRAIVSAEGASRHVSHRITRTIDGCPQRDIAETGVENVAIRTTV